MTQLKKRIRIPAIYEKPQKTIVNKTVQRKAYFAQTDQRLGMLAREDVTVRVIGNSTIRKIIEENHQRKKCTDRSDQHEKYCCCC